MSAPKQNTNMNGVSDSQLIGEEKEALASMIQLAGAESTGETGETQNKVIGWNINGVNTDERELAQALQ